ncbi:MULTISPECIES: phage tail tape measure protein [unclassified Vibrio]|uniref:phage tail tape measure protein n=1 Tax=unclassified Vibrio TaxID=2614977 RepID=UPI000B8E8FAF|nr:MULTISPECIES: phage tail tape measure protein [unclassified Vibrio]NAW98964.1 phage tail tape measure protein [Vibrio sp. V23_P3S9T160]OXX25734.1 phage tail tape measure protein [Vibrio sp. V05_P4A8T149]OXX29973.1 phage tail tape measure protein [Vibrio sp. V04_P4A5T148]OXX32398.1 phage tail tape measure protein [Vibrio sp. V14_P6S14T42]OXX41188.1 phage tail tape measure protein [Vibrio sp. V11_P1A41T118]
MATSNNSGYALELIVGVKDAFTQQSKKIENESKKLEREFKQLQKTTADVDAFKKAENALKELNQQETKNKKAITAQERELERLGRTLKNTGVDVNNIAQEERRLQAEIQKTNQGLKQQGSALQHIEKIGTIAGGAMASAGLAWAGNDKARNERLLAARSSYSLEEVQSASQRQFRTDLIRMYGADQESIFAAQALAKQQNLGEEDTQALTKATIQLQKIFPDYSSPETVRALANISKGFGISIEEAANKLYATSSMVGDANGDLLDTFAEYSPLLGDKISFDQFAASIVRARQAGVWNTDKVGDSFKESFMARFSDEGEFAKLVGEGDKAGTVDAIEDVDLRNRIKEAAYRVRNDVATGTAPGNNYAALLALVNSVSQTDAAAVKPILEAIGGTIMSEDIGTKGLNAMQQGMQEGAKVFEGVDSLDDAAKGISTSIDKATQSFNSMTDTVSNSAAKLIDKFDGLGNAVSNVTGSTTGAMNDNSALGYAGLAGAVGTAAFGGLLLSRLGKKAVGKILGTAMGSQGAFKPAGMFSGLFTKSAAEPVANVAKGPSFWSTAGQKALGGGKGVLKKLPVIGTALNAASIGMSAMDGDTEGVWRSIGSTVGGGLGGLTGALFGGVGALPGTIGGSIAGDEIAGWLYDVFNGGDDKVNQQAVAQVEQTVQSASAQSRAIINQPPATVEVSFAPVIQIESASTEPDVMAQTLVAALRDMTPQLKQTLHDVMDDLWKDMDHVDLG